MKLDDCGKEFIMEFSTQDKHYIKRVEVSMVIQGPKGTLTLFRQEPEQHNYGTFDYTNQLKQCEAIRAFMEINNEKKD